MLKDASVHHVQRQPGAAHRLLREPLFHFLTLACLLFLAQAMFAGDEREDIVVDATTQEFLIQQHEDLSFRRLSDAEKRELVAGFVDEEILVREAQKRGFADSSRVRALLLQNMRFFISGDIADPSEEDLRAFYDAQKESFRSPPSLDLDHLLFRDPAKVPARAIDELNAGADPAGYGDTDRAFARRLRFMDASRLARAYGPEAARAILAIPGSNDRWHGPFISPQGSAHLIRVVGHHQRQVPDFGTARDWIKTQWFAAKSRELMEAELAGLRPEYRVEIEPLGGAVIDD